MGLLEHRWLDHHGVQGLVVKNTFFDVDLPVPETAEPLCRAQTVPVPACSEVSTSGNVSPRSSDVQEVPVPLSLPGSPASSLGLGPAVGFGRAPEEAVEGHGLAKSTAAAGEEADCALPKEAGWDLCVRRTFVEYQQSEPSLRRTASAPDLGRREELELEQELLGIKCSMPLGHAGAAHEAGECQPVPLGEVSPASSLHTLSWPPTPVADQCPVMFFCMPQQPAFFAAEVEGAWPAQYEQVAYEGEQLESTSAAAGGRRRHQKRGKGTAVISADEQQPLHILADARRTAMEGRTGKVWSLACRDRDSSFAVQQAFGMLATTLNNTATQQDFNAAQFDAQAMLSQLQGHVVEALQHPHANHVIKQVLDTMPTDLLAFIADELLGCAAWASRHRFGCRAVLRLARHCGRGGWASARAEAAMDEVLLDAAGLCSDEYGKFVLEELLEHGLPGQRIRVLDALKARPLQSARHEHASFLVQRALRSCSKEDSESLVDVLLGSLETVRSLMRSQFGRYVLRDLARSDCHADVVRGMLAPLAEELRSSKQGRKLIEEIGLSQQ